MRRAVLLLCWLLSAAAPPDLSDTAFDQRPGAALPLDAQLIDQTGRAATLGAFIDHRPAVLVFGYYACPTLCGVVRDDVLSGLARTGLAAGRDFTLLEIGIDPAETPADAAAAFRADLGRAQSTGRYYLTGDARAVAEAAGFRGRFEPRLKQIVHPAGVVFATAGGIVSGYQLGVGYAPDDLRAGIARAAEQRVAPTASPILLLCFHFDPTTGRYTPAIMRMVQTASVLTALGIGAFLLRARLG